MVMWKVLIMEIMGLVRGRVECLQRRGISDVEAKYASIS